MPICWLAQNRQIFRTHHRCHGRGIIAGKAHITIGDDPNQQAGLVHNRKTGHVIALLQRFGISQGLIGCQRNRVINNAAFKPLHAAHLTGLFLGVKIAMDHTHSPGLCQRNRHARFCHCIHGRAEQWNVQRNRRRHAGARIGCVWQDVRRRWNQQNIVKGKCLANLHKIILLLQVSFDRLLFHDPAEKERGFREKFQTQKIMMFNFAQKPSSNDAQRKRARQPVARLETIRNRHEHTWL